MIDREALRQEIIRREHRFITKTGDYGQDGSYFVYSELDHDAIAAFVIEMIKHHTFTIQEEP